MFSGRFLQNRKFIFIPTARLLCPSFSPRKDFGGEEELCKSIMENGISEPLTVRPAMKNKYTVVSGERRLRAARAAGLSKVPCVVLCQSDRQSAITALLHGLCKKPLNMFEQAEGIYNLITRYGVERDEAAELLGLSEGQLMSKLRLLNFSALERERILGLGLSEGQAKVLLRIPDEKTRERELVTKIPERAAGFSPAVKTGAMDGRIITNTLLRAVESIKKAGISAAFEKNETEDEIVYKISLPKV